MARKPTNRRASSTEEEMAGYVQRLLSQYVATDFIKRPRTESGYQFDGSFTGIFRGQSGRWLVEIRDPRALLRPKAIEAIGQRARAYGDGEFDGLLIVTTAGVQHKPRIMRGLHDVLPGKFIEVRDVKELQNQSGFDSYSDEYPGAVATIGHNSDVYLDAIEAINEVLQRLRTSNSLELTADVRDRLLVEVEAGQTLLGKTKVRVAALASTIIPALKFIALTCATGVLGDIAQKAFWALDKLIFP